MKPENDDKLSKAFPDLYVPDSRFPQRDFFHFECQDGWFDLLWELSERLQRVLDNSPIREQIVFQASQVKEKFGSLRYYYIISTTDENKILEDIDGYNELYKEIVAQTSWAEKRSFEICEICGKDGSIKPGLHWIQSLCSEHYFSQMLRQKLLGRN
jgi:hypothetical protein